MACTTILVGKKRLMMVQPLLHVRKIHKVAILRQNNLSW